jgi:hypothetical protein
VRHETTQRRRSWRWLALAGALAVACQPIPRGHLRAETTTASHEVHLVVRMNADALARAEGVFVAASVSARDVDAVVLLPDDPRLTGVSVGAAAGFATLSASLELTGIVRESCDTDGICEVGITVIVTPAPDTEMAVPSDVSLGAYASTEPEGLFPESASLELEIDGEAPIVGVRSSR